MTFLFIFFHFFYNDFFPGIDFHPNRYPTRDIITKNSFNLQPEERGKA